jgi:benzoyl-CoA reductase/2-hydroxyglutaryl-CoA dehydratase subunit BcrC/BadD/HgdB
MRVYNAAAEGFAVIRDRAARGVFKGGAQRLQQLYNSASCRPLSETAAELAAIAGEPEEDPGKDGGVPVFLFGNVLPDPEAMALFTRCGARVAGDDMCTGSRLFTPLATEGGGVPALARVLLTAGPACARTFRPEEPLHIAGRILKSAVKCKARGVIGHTLKFCDPYLARLPAIRETLREAAMPLLLLEGDCTLRSMGQQRTRIEAFVEMLR